MHSKRALQLGFVIDVVANARDSVAGHLDQLGTYVDAVHDITKASKVFAQPA